MSHTELHPLRGGLAIVGGLVVGLGLGLAFGHVPAHRVDCGFLKAGEP